MADADADLRPADDVARRVRATGSGSTSRSSFWGGSEVIAPDGAPIFGAPLYDEGLYHGRLDLADIRREPGSRCRCSATSGRSSRSASSSGSSPSGPGWPDSTADDRRAGLDVGRGPRLDRVGSRPAGRLERRSDREPLRRSSCRPSWRSTPTSPGGSSASSSAASSARRASSGRSLGLSGGIDSALVAYLVAEAIGAEQLLCVLMPYRTSSPESRTDAEAVVGRLGCAAELVDITPMVDGYFGADGRPARSAPRAGGEPAPARQLHGPDADGGPLRPLGDLAAGWSSGPATRPSRSSATRPCSATTPAPSTRSATCTRARSASWRPRSASPTRSSRKAPSADLWPGQTDEIRGRLQLPGARPAAVLADRQAPLARGARRAGLRGRRWSSGSTGWSRAPEFKRQVPPIAKLGPRTAGVDYLYPRRRPGSARDGDRGRDAATTAIGRRRRAACTSSRRRSATSATSRSGRIETLRAVPLDRGRGHPATPPAARPARDRRRGSSASTPGAPGAAAGAARAPARRRRPGARHRRRDARRQRSRATSSSRPGRRRAGRSCRSRAPRRCWRPSPASGVAGPRWTFEGFLPRSGRERRERLARIAADERGCVVYEAPGRVPATLARPGRGLRRRARRARSAAS